MAEPTDPTAPCSWCQIVLFLGAELPNIISGKWNSLLHDLFQPIWPFDYLFPNFYDYFFGGRSKSGPDSATDNTARVLMLSQNPVVRLWGAAVRVQEAKGFILSDSRPWVQQLLSRPRHAAYADLVTQFGTDIGTQTWRRYVNLAYSRECNQSGGPERPVCIQTMRGIDRATYIYFVSQGWIDPKTGQPTGKNPYSTKCNC